jgi:hypothetical protein
MFLGAQITQMLLDGSHQKNYIDLIRHFHRQIVGSSVSVPDPDLCIRLTIAMDVSYSFQLIYTNILPQSIIARALRVHGIRHRNRLFAF